MSIVQSVLESAEQELRRRPNATLKRIGLRIGELSAVDPDSLSFSFECLSPGTKCEGAELVMESTPWTRRCGSCGREFHVKNFQTDCPACGGASENIAGDELEIAWLELEEA